MPQKEDIKSIWRECFDDSPEYVDMYFSRVYNPADAMTLESGGRTVSSLLLQSYSLMFHGAELSMGYIAGAGTRKSSRGNGFMARLLQQSLQRASERGMALVSLIPAHAWLYDYYARFGFAPVVLADAQRFTALHSFGSFPGFTPVDDSYAPEVYEAFSRMERSRPCAVLHTHKQFLDILDDLRLDGGHFAALRDSSGSIAAMAWAAEDATLGRVVVKDLLFDQPEAAETALAMMRGYFGDSPFSVIMPPESAAHSGRRLMRRGMMRVVRPADLLAAIAAASSETNVTIRLTDTIIPDNDGYYTLSGGSLSRPATFVGTPDYDIDPDVLARVIFSAPSTGSVLGLPTIRPHLSLMLD